MVDTNCGCPDGTFPYELTRGDIFFVAGFIPVVGPFIDIADAVISLAEGDYADAALSIVFAFIDINDLFRLADRMGGLADRAEYTLRQLPDDAAEFRQARQYQIDAVFSKNEQFRLATQRLDDQWRASGMSADFDNKTVSEDQIKALLANKSDTETVLTNLQHPGIGVTLEDVDLLKRYMFDYAYLESLDANKYDAWNSIVSGNPTYRQMGILVHELEEVRKLVELFDLPLDENPVLNEALNQIFKNNRHWDRERKQILIDNTNKLAEFFNLPLEQNPLLSFLSSSNYDVIEPFQSWDFKRLHDRFCYDNSRLDDKLSRSFRYNNKIQYNFGHSQALAAEFQYYTEELKAITGRQNVTFEEIVTSVLSHSEAATLRLQSESVTSLSRAIEAYKNMYLKDGSGYTRLLNHPEQET